MTFAAHGPPWSEGFELSPERLCAGTWRLTAGDGSPLAQHVRLTPNGGVTGWFNEGDRSWRIDGAQLVFLDRYDRRSVLFERSDVGPDGRLTFSGATLAGGEGPAGRVLTEIEPYGGLRATAPTLQLRVRPPVRPRKNLVILRANEASLHHQWLRNIDDADRNWDFCISYYGDPANFGQDDFAEFQILQGSNRKYEAIYDLLYEGSPLWAYDYVAFPDDDLVATWRDINEMFAICRRFELDLAQPSLTGFVTHLITRPDPEYFLRYVSFVEPITPFFSRAALRTCTASFVGVRSGYGLDHVWPKLLGEPRARMAIVDAISFEHTRPVAVNYSMDEALAEGWGFQMGYDAYPREVVYGGVLKRPVDFYMRW